MNGFLRGVARSMIESFDLPEPIVEIGSFQVPGQEELIDLRGLLPNRHYTGVDFRPGPGVDLVANVENLPFASGTVGTVLAFSVFEHVKHFWRGFDEVFRVLRPDGALLVCTPFYFRVHDHPSDYWRFTPEALDTLLERYPTRVLGWHGPDRRPLNVWAAGFGDRARAPTDEQITAYKKRLAIYGKQPIGWSRHLRFKLGQILCGRRPFATHLDCEKWGTEVRCA